MAKTALILGASGLIGGLCLKELEQDPNYQNIIVVCRNTMALSSPKVIQKIVDFSKLSQELQEVKADDVFCCLGTTIRKAGSQAAFYQVDFSYPLEAAKVLQKNGARHFLLVTAMGAKSNSLIFYNRVKGQIEDAVQALGYPALSLFRPSLLLGNRQENRAGEKVSIVLFGCLGFLFCGPLLKYRPIAAENVAKAMLKQANNFNSGVVIIENDKMFS